MSALPACWSSGGAILTQASGGRPDQDGRAGARNRVPPRVRARITWSVVRTAKNQNTQVTAVASRSRVTSRCSRLRGLGGLRVGADIDGPRLSIIVIIENRK